MLQSSLVDDAFAAGTKALSEGKIELGQELVQDALQLSEQVFGSVHGESASKYHTLGLGAFWILGTLSVAGLLALTMFCLSQLRSPFLFFSIS